MSNFQLYTGDSRVYPTYGSLLVTNGAVVDFAALPVPPDGRWSATSGPATVTINPSVTVPVVPQLAVTSQVYNPGTGAPTTGSYSAGELAVDSTGAEFLCTASGTPGTWVAMSGGGSGVSSVNTRTGAVTLTKTDVGLANVDNTSDVNKPVSTAQATANALALAKASNLSDLANAATARTNLGLGSAATTSSSSYEPVSQTAAGAAAPMAFALDPVTFLTVVDPIWKIGYNPDRPITSEPQFYVGIEGDYKIASGAEGWDNTGTHLLNEFYVNYASADNSTVVNFRPVYVGVLRDDNTSHAAHIFFDIGTGSTTNSELVIQAGPSTPIVTMTSQGLFIASGMALKIGAAQVLTPPATKAASFSFTPNGQFASTPVANTQYRARVIIRDSAALTGIAVMNDSAVAGNVIVSLYDSTGTQVAVSNSTACAGTFSPQFVPFTATYTPVDGVYYITSIFSSASTHLDLVNSLSGGAGTAAIGSFTTPGSFTPPAINSGAQVPIMSTY